MSDDDLPIGKKPSGAAFRRLRREREERERREAVDAGDQPPRPEAPPIPGATKVYGWMVGLLAEEMKATYEDKGLPDERRRRTLAELARAAGMVRAKFEYEVEAEDTRQRLLALEEKLAAAPRGKGRP